MSFLISTAMRVGSTWVCRMVQDALRIPTVYRYIDKDIINKDDGEQEITEKLIQLSGEPYLKSHEIFPEYFERLTHTVPNLNIINIVRNKQDALYSRFIFAKYHRPCQTIKETIGDIFFMAPDDVSLEMLLHEKKILQTWYDHFDRFNVEINTPKILTLKYESLVSGDLDYFESFLKFLGRKPSREYLEYFIAQHSFQRYRQIEKGKFTDRDDKHLFHRTAGVESVQVQLLKSKL
jgi:hypothetical protein